MVFGTDHAPYYWHNVCKAACMLVKLGVLFKGFAHRLKETFTRFKEVDPFTESGSLAYTTVFAIPGMIILVLAIAGYFYDANEVRHALYTQAGGFVGSETATQLENMVAAADEHKSGIFAKIVGMLALVVSATAAFAALQSSLNKVWRIAPVKGKAVVRYLLARMLSLGLIAAFGFMLLMSLVLDAVLVAVGDRLGETFPAQAVILGVLGAMLSFGMVTVIFALVFKLLPDAKVAWRWVWSGALFTGVLFTLGKFLIGLYISKTGAGDAYGAGGAVVILLLWAFYSSIILLFGAQYTYVTAGAFKRSIYEREPLADPIQGSSPK